VYICTYTHVCIWIYAYICMHCIFVYTIGVYLSTSIEWVNGVVHWMHMYIRIYSFLTARGTLREGGGERKRKEPQRKRNWHTWFWMRSVSDASEASWLKRESSNQRTSATSTLVSTIVLRCSCIYIYTYCLYMCVCVCVCVCVCMCARARVCVRVCVALVRRRGCVFFYFQTCAHAINSNSTIDSMKYIIFWKWHMLQPRRTHMEPSWQHTSISAKALKASDTLSVSRKQFIEFLCRTAHPFHLLLHLFSLSLFSLKQKRHPILKLVHFCTNNTQSNHEH